MGTPKFNDLLNIVANLPEDPEPLRENYDATAQVCCMDYAQHSTHSSTSSQLGDILIDPSVSRPALAVIYTASGILPMRVTHFILPMREKQS